MSQQEMRGQQIDSLDLPGTFREDTRPIPARGKEAQMGHNQKSLISLQNEGRKPFSQVSPGDLVTVSLRLGEGSVECGARVERIAHGTYIVKLAGLSVPEPYKIGDKLPVQEQLIVDWE